MTNKEFFPKVTIEGLTLILNAEAIETMDLDVEDAKVILIETTNVEKKTQPKEILIMKTNGSLCDDPENIKDVFSPENIRTVRVNKEDDGTINHGVIDINQSTVDSITEILGDKKEFKLLVCNNESALGKEFKEQFDIAHNYYRFVLHNDKRISVGKDRNVKNVTEERVSIN
jgi:hypothetical protein